MRHNRHVSKNELLQDKVDEMENIPIYGPTSLDKMPNEDTEGMPELLARIKELEEEKLKMLSLIYNLSQTRVSKPHPEYEKKAEEFLEGWVVMMSGDVLTREAFNDAAYPPDDEDD